MRAVRHQDPGRPVTDDELLVLFREDPDRAWGLFLDRYADSMFRQLQRLGWDYDEAMDRFTYICEKLSEKGFRRMLAIRHTGTAGELTPWLRTVVERLSISWLWSVEGRDRMFRTIAALPALDQRVFELHFRHGLTPGAIHEQICVETQQPLAVADVFDALENIFARLSPNRIWRLLSQLSRTRGPLSIERLAERSDDSTTPWEPADPGLTPEERLIQREESEQAGRLLDALPVRDRLILRMRYDDALDPAQIASLLRIDEDAVRNRLRAALTTLRKSSAAAGTLSVGRSVMRSGTDDILP
jgi:RNA polymerase sigma factor (sigma-70 family)